MQLDLLNFLGDKTIERLDSNCGGQRLYRITEHKANQSESAPYDFLLPSVTSIISRRQKNESLENWRRAVGEKEADRVANAAARRGTWFHKQCENFLLQTTPTSSKVDYNALIYKNLWNKMRSVLIECISIVHGVEVMLFSEKARCAGTVDCIARTSDGHLCIVDFKTSTSRKASSDISSYWLQCAAYALMCQEMLGEMPQKLVVIMAVENEEEILVFEEDPSFWVEKFLILRENYSRTHLI